MHVEGKDIVITDIIYIMNDADDEIIDIGECATNNGSLNKIGLNNCITASGCEVIKSTVYNTKKEVIGQFCSDSNVVGCFLLEEIIAHKPSLADEIKEQPHAYALIPNFTGDVTFTIRKEKYYDEKLPLLNIKGKGNINFYTDFEPGWDEEE